MNKDRRARIAKISEELQGLRDQIQDLQSEEQEAFDAMPESLQQGDQAAPQSPEGTAMTEETLDDRIQARIDRIANARDQVVGTLIADLKTSILSAEKGGQAPNPLECRAVAILDRAFPFYQPPSGDGGRGQLTDEVRAAMESFFGRGTTTAELRLLPYVHYCAVNDRKIDPQRVNEPERQILSNWRAAGLIEGGASGLKIDAGFWRFIGEILLIAYVDFDLEGVIQAPAAD